MSQFPYEMCYDVFRKLDNNFSKKGAPSGSALYLFTANFIMKKSSPHKNIKTKTSIPNAVPEDCDFTALRQKIRNRVGQEALGMIESTINGVNNGQYMALKYLFEAVSLFPADISDESRQQDVLAPTLLRALGLPEAPVSEHAVTKDSVKR